MTNIPTSMLRSFLLVLALLACALVKAQTTDIPWTAERRLTWDDFKGRVDRSSNKAAMTDSGISMAVSCDGGVPNATVSCSFSPKRSWLRGEGTPDLLRHERLHFDITELFARKLRKELAAISDCRVLAKKAEAMHSQMFDASSKYQDRYDRETQHGTRPEEQTEWQQRIEKELAELAQYASR
jgi:hypothetical protein